MTLFLFLSGSFGPAVVCTSDGWRSRLILTRWAPTCYEFGYNFIYRGYNLSYPFIRPFTGVTTPFITGRGPPCSNTMTVLAICS